MSKRIEDSELQTLTLSPTNTNDDESSLFINPASDETAFPISPPPTFPLATAPSAPPEKRKLERMSSVPLNTTKVVPMLRVSTPPGSSKISYTNERSNERKIDFSKISRDRPMPGSSLSQKKEASHHSEKSRPSGLVLSVGGVGKSMPKSSHKKTDIYSGSRPFHTSHATKGSLKKTPETSEFNFKPLSRNYHGQSLPMAHVSSSTRAGSKGWMGRAGLRSGLRMREGIDSRQMDRPTQHHSFLTDVADVRQIEQGLLQLMEDFQAGNLRAFGKDSRLRQMEAIREQQERLARLHFDVGAEQDLYPPLSEEGLRTSHDNMRTLMEKLAQLSESIENLHTTTSSDRKTSSNERKSSAHHMLSSAQASLLRPADHTNLNLGSSHQKTADCPATSSLNDPQNISNLSTNCTTPNVNFNLSTQQHSSSVNSNTVQGQPNVNPVSHSRNSAGYPTAMKNGKTIDS